jgi:hypothetical protein
MRGPFPAHTSTLPVASNRELTTGRRVAKRRAGIYKPGYRGWTKIKNPGYWRREGEFAQMQRGRERQAPIGSVRTPAYLHRAHARRLLGGGHQPLRDDHAGGHDPGGQPAQRWPIERRPYARPAPSSGTCKAAEASSTSSAATTPSPRSTLDSRSSPAPATRRERQRGNVERGHHGRRSL